MIYNHCKSFCNILANYFEVLSRFLDSSGLCQRLELDKKVSL